MLLRIAFATGLATLAGCAYAPPRVTSTDAFLAERAAQAERLGRGCGGRINPVFPAAAGADYPGDCWNLRTDAEAMTDVRSCTINPVGRPDSARLRLYITDHESVISVFGSRGIYPGSRIHVRVDQAPAVSGEEIITGAAAASLITDLMAGETVMLRYTQWPAGTTEDGTQTLAGLGEAVTACREWIASGEPPIK